MKCYLVEHLLQFVLLVSLLLAHPRERYLEPLLKLLHRSCVLW